MDGGRSRTSQEEDEGRRASKQLRVTPQVQEKEVVVQPEPQAWLPALMLHGEPLIDDASLRDFIKVRAFIWLTHWRGPCYSLPIWQT